MIFIYLLPVFAVVLCGAIIYLEERYYARHPEKTRPPAEDPYGPHLN